MTDRPPESPADQDAARRSPRGRKVFLILVASLAAVAGAALVTTDPPTRRAWALTAAGAGYDLIGFRNDDAGDAAAEIPLFDEADAAAAIAAAWPGGAEVTVEIDQPATARPLPFRREDLRDPAFLAFASRLEETLGGAIPDDPFAACDAIRRLAPHGVPAEDPGGHPARCLAAAAGPGPLLCHNFAALAAHALLAKGYETRVLGISADGGAFEHAVLEFYDPAARRWILLDPDFNLAYRRVAGWPSDDAGSWMSARDLHAAAADLVARELDAGDADLVRREAGIEAVVLGAAGGPLRASHLRGGQDSAGRRSLARLFRTVFYAARNDHLTSSYPPGHPDAVRQYVLWDGPTEDLPPVCPEGTRLTDSGVNRLYAPAHGVWCESWEIRPAGTSDPSPRLTCGLQWARRPTGAGRLSARDGSGPIEISADGTLAWPLSPGTNRVVVTAAPTAGGSAVSSSLQVIVRPTPVSPLTPDAP